MAFHYLTMTTNDAHDHLTCTCSCGWTSGPHPVADDDDWQAIQTKLIAESTIWHAEQAEQGGQP
jgi:hypothetical protein